MRSTLINKVIDSDIDLTPLSCNRVLIQHVAVGQFQISSTFRVHKCGVSSFIGRYLNRKKKGMTYITGNCSTPTGYFWGPMNNPLPHKD